MSAKTKSTIHKTTFPDPDVAEFTFDPEEYKAPALPRRLNEPMQVDMARLLRLNAASRSLGEVAGMEAWSQWEGMQVGELRARWTDLFTFYQIDGRSSEDAWKQLAIALARDFVPGLRVENISPSLTALNEQRRLFAVVNVVASAMKRRKEVRSGEVSERFVLQHDFFDKYPWSADLFGEKPESIGTFATRFVRDKEKFARLLLDQDWTPREIIRSFEMSGLEPPGFLKDLPLGLADLSITK